MYRQHYCLLRETTALPGDPQWSARVLRQRHALIYAIRRRFEALRPIRRLDLEKEATLVFCEALEALGDHYAVYAFASRGAGNVQVRRVEGFTEAYGEVVRQRLAGLQTETYTRLGAPFGT